MNCLKKEKKLAHEMLSELSAGNKQRMNTMKHELKVKLKLIESQRKRSMEIINNETKLISIELAQNKPPTIKQPEQTAMHQRGVSPLTAGQQILPNRFRHTITPVSRSSDERLPDGRSTSDVMNSNISNKESRPYYSHGVVASPDSRTHGSFYPKGVNQYTSEFRKKVSELNTSRHHRDAGITRKVSLQTPGLKHYLRTHSGGMNNGMTSDAGHARRNSDTSLQTSYIFLSDDRMSPNTDEYGTNRLQADNLAVRAHTASGLTGRMSSSLLLPSLDAPSRDFQSRDTRGPKSLCIGRQRSSIEQSQFVPRPPSCRGYTIKSFASLHGVMQRSSAFKADDFEKTEDTS